MGAHLLAVDAADRWWLLLGIAWFALVPAAGLALAYAVGKDARARGGEGTTWAVATATLPFAVLAYLVVRRRHRPERASVPGPSERVAGAYGGGFFLAMLVGMQLSPPDPFSAIFWITASALGCVPLVYLACYGSAGEPLRRRLG